MNRELVYHWTGVIFKHFKELYAPPVQAIGGVTPGRVASAALPSGADCRGLGRMSRCQTGSIERRLRDVTADEKFELAAVLRQLSVQSCRALAKRERVLLLVDETTIGKHYRAMVIGVAFERRCMQLIWRCYKSNSKAAYPPGGQVKMLAEMLAQLKAALPADRQGGAAGGPRHRQLAEAVSTVAGLGLGHTLSVCQKTSRSRPKKRS